MSTSEHTGDNAGKPHVVTAAAQGSAAPATRAGGGKLIELFERPTCDGKQANQVYRCGHADGAAFRAQGAPISPYLSVGIDEYALGFRAGYYQR